MNEIIKTLEQIQTALSGAFLSDTSPFPDFDSTLDEENKTLSITIVDSGTQFIIREVNTTSTPKIFELAMDDPSKYSRVFDESNLHYERTEEFNRMFLESQQRYMNHKLQEHGFVFLNEVYEALGFERTPEGQVVGWLYNKESDEMSYVDFGVNFDPDKPLSDENKAIILNFNVQGVIYDKI